MTPLPQNITIVSPPPLCLSLSHPCSTLMSCPIFTESYFYHLNVNPLPFYLVTYFLSQQKNKKTRMSRMYMIGMKVLVSLSLTQHLIDLASIYAPFCRLIHFIHNTNILSPKISLSPPLCIIYLLKSHPN